MIHLHANKRADPIKIGIPCMEALHEKDPNPEDYTGQNANAGLEAPPEHLRRRQPARINVRLDTGVIMSQINFAPIGR